MNLILTMAGRYTRFINEGYRIPKYLLPWGANSILKEIIEALCENNNFDNIYLITNKRDDIYMSHVRQILKKLDIPTSNLFQISDTEGQAESAYLGLKLIEENFTDKINGPVVFHNIDTILYNRDFANLSIILDKYDGYIDVFKSSNHNYSYVLLENGKVEDIAEKVVISNNASSGLYVFRNKEIFLDYYSNETLYISDIYKKMLKENKNIAISKIHSEHDTVILGTPSEYLTNAYILDL